MLVLKQSITYLRNRSRWRCLLLCFLRKMPMDFFPHANQCKEKRVREGTHLLTHSGSRKNTTVNWESLALLVSLIFPGLYIHSAFYSISFSELCRDEFCRDITLSAECVHSSSCGSLCLFSSAAEGSFSEDGWIKQRSMSFTECH